MATRKSNQRSAFAPLQIHHDEAVVFNKKGGQKRAAGQMSPEVAVQGNKNKKRAAFGDITNATKVTGKNNDDLKKVKKSTTAAGTKKKRTTQVVVAVPKTSSSQSSSEKNDISYEVIELSQPTASQGSNSSSLESNPSSPSSIDLVEQQNQLNDQLSHRSTPELSEGPWDDIDSENLADPYQAAEYAAFIFQYYRERESKFTLGDYMRWQSDLTPHMRSILVDWLVEVQENFELNHETLYLAVKLVDQYLNRVKVNREKLQLVGAVALFISCKYDERCPPVIDDFLYICDDAYTREEMITKERDILNTIQFDLGIPLSYRNLRRYAKCTRASMETLTLGRYILEMSLMDYDFSRCSESKLAAACLFLALQMRKTGDWDSNLVHHTSYTRSDLMPLVVKLNSMVAAPANKQLSTIRSKYSHKVFHEVAKISPLDAKALVELDSSNMDVL